MPTETTSEWNLLRRRKRLLGEMQELVGRNLMRGTLYPLKRRCGKKGCVCATEGRKHESLCVSVNVGGKTRLRYVRPDQEQEVRMTISRYRRFWKLLDELTEVNLGLLRAKRGARRSETK